MARPALIARALILAALTLAPLVAVTAGAGARHGFVAHDAEIALQEVNPVDHPENVFTVDSAAMQAAQQIGMQHWGSYPCGAKVVITWAELDDDVNAQSSWTNPASAYDDPEFNGDCKITFNPRADFDWPKFCTVMVHELGHLVGRQHSPDPNDVMAAYYSVPLPDCTGPAPEGVPAPPAPAAAPPAPKAKAASLRAKPTRKAAKRAKKHRRLKHRRHAVRHRRR